MSKIGARIRAMVQRLVNKWLLVLVLNDADLSMLKNKSALLLPSNKRKNTGGMHTLCSSSANQRFEGTVHEKLPTELTEFYVAALLSSISVKCPFSLMPPCW